MMGWVDSRGSRAGTRQKGEASHRGHGGHRGKLGLVGECTWVKIVTHVREHARAESIAQRSRRPQRGIGVGGGMHLGEDRWLTCGNTPRGESIAQRSRRPQREIGVGGRMHLGEDRYSRAGTRQSGKHRTEVTEATEGDWGRWTNALG
jgi:hypothetical protein